MKSHVLTLLIALSTLAVSGCIWSDGDICNRYPFTLVVSEGDDWEPVSDTVWAEVEGRGGAAPRGSIARWQSQIGGLTQPRKCANAKGTLGRTRIMATTCNGNDSGQATARPSSTIFYAFRSGEKSTFPH
jgi:hypothetical protein